MKTVKAYESFNVWGKSDQDGSEDQDNIEILTKIIEEIKPMIKEYLGNHGLVLDEIEVDDEESFWITYEPTSYDGALPNNISQCMQGLADLIFKQLLSVTKVGWSFGANTRCTLAMFYLRDLNYTKFLQLRKLFKLEGGI